MAVESKKVYDLLNQIPKGKITTYKEIAKKLNSKAYQAIGKIISKNPNIPSTPCHRVVKINGDISGYALGVDKKITLLKSEGIEIFNNKIVNFNEKLHKF